MGLRGVLFRPIGFPRSSSIHFFSPIVSLPNSEPRPAASISAFKRAQRQVLSLKIASHEISSRKPVLEVSACMSTMVPILILSSLSSGRKRSNAGRLISLAHDERQFLDE